VKNYVAQTQWMEKLGFVKNVPGFWVFRILRVFF